MHNNYNECISNRCNHFHAFKQPSHVLKISASSSCHPNLTTWPKIWFGRGTKDIWPKGRSSKGRKSICCQNRVVRTNCRFHLKRDKFWSTSHQFNFWGPWVGSVNPPITTIRSSELTPKLLSPFQLRTHLQPTKKSFMTPVEKKLICLENNIIVWKVKQTKIIIVIVDAWWKQSAVVAAVAAAVVTAVVAALDAA